MGGKFIPGIYHSNYAIMKYMIGSGFSTEIYMNGYGFQKYWIYEWGVFWKSQRYVCTQKYRKRPPRVAIMCYRGKIAVEILNSKTLNFDNFQRNYVTTILIGENVFKNLIQTCALPILLGTDILLRFSKHHPPIHIFNIFENHTHSYIYPLKIQSYIS